LEDRKELAMSNKITPEFPGGEDLLADGRFTTVEQVEAATDTELLSVHNIGPAKLEAIRAATKSPAPAKSDSAETAVGATAEVQTAAEVDPGSNRVRVELPTKTVGEKEPLRGFIAGIEWDENGEAENVTNANVHELNRRFGASNVTVLPPKK
jgi:hypothetical protein